MRKLLLLGSLLVANLAWAAKPYIAVPNLVYDEGVTNYGVTNALVKKAIIKDGQYRIMNTPKNFNVAAVVAEINNNKLPEESETHDVQLGKSTSKYSKQTPRYILVGQVVSSDISDSFYDIKGTTNTSGTKTLSMSVDYDLLDLENNAIISSFNVNASGSQAVILQQSNKDIRVSKSKLVNAAAQDLANQVADELSQTKVKHDDDTVQN